MLSDDGKEPNTAKGVNIATEFDEFKDTFFSKKILRHKMKRIQSEKHKLGTYEINKISLSSFDDERFILDDGINALAYFHKDLKNRISQMIKNKKGFEGFEGFKKILIKIRDSHRLSQIKISAYKQTLDRWVDMATCQQYSI